MTEYSGAVQNSARTFQTAELASAAFRFVPPMGLPAFASGQNAVVFESAVAGTPTAVRCFTTEPSEGRRRYQALGSLQARSPVAALASADWVDDALAVNGRSWPIVTMEWVSGQQLHEWVESNLNSSATLRNAAAQWLEITMALRSVRLAHGDLQHGNILVSDDGTIRLIDFDQVWLEELAGVVPDEVGHPNYQHPDRGANGHWGEHIDWFSALVIYVSFLALAADPGLWDCHMGDNLILTEEDFRGPTSIWGRLFASPDPQVAHLSNLLADSCTESPLMTTDLGGLVKHHESVKVEDAATLDASWSVDSRGVVTGAAGAGSQGFDSATVSSAATGRHGEWWNQGTADASPQEDTARSRQQPRGGPRQREERDRQDVHDSWSGAANGSGAPEPEEPDLSDLPPPTGPRLADLPPTSRQRGPASPVVQVLLALALVVVYFATAEAVAGLETLSKIDAVGAAVSFVPAAVIAFLLRGSWGSP